MKFILEIEENYQITDQYKNIIPLYFNYPLLKKIDLSLENYDLNNIDNLNYKVENISGESKITVIPTDELNKSFLNTEVDININLIIKEKETILI